MLDVVVVAVTLEEILKSTTKVVKMAPAPVQTFHMDSRLPVSPDADESDPNHPRNVTKGLLMTQNQATADTKYDIQPPPRVEGFSSMPLPTDRQMIWAVFFSSLITAAVSISFLAQTQNKYVRIFFILATVFSLNYGIVSLEKLTV